MARLPSLHALRAFESAARLGGFKLAAEELNVSPTAVSHHIRGLEEELGSALFVREVRRVRLTEAGERLARSCTDAFDNLSEAVGEFRQTEDRPSVTLALGPILASRWLTARLSRFWEQFPGIDLRLLHTPMEIDPNHVKADIFLAWGDGHWGQLGGRLKTRLGTGLDGVPFLQVAATPVASPQLLGRLGRPSTPDALLGYPLIHQRDQVGWSEWLSMSGTDGVPSLGGVVIEDANVVLRSAIEGQGVSLGWLPFINAELESGRLVRLFDQVLIGRRAYYLIRSPYAPTGGIVDQVIDWLLSEAGATKIEHRPEG